MAIYDELTLEYLQGIDWEAPLHDASPNTCESYWTRFFQAAKLAGDQGNLKEQFIFALLGKVSSLYLKAEEKSIPLGPLATFGNKRTSDIGDYSLDDIEVLKKLTICLKRHDLLARLGDVIWIVHPKDNFHYAELAIDSYLLSGEEQLFGKTYTIGVERLTRALHLAASLGRQSDRYRKVVDKIETLIDPFLPKHNSPVSGLLRLLIEFREGDLQKLAHDAEISALDAEANKNWYIAGHYWEMNATCHRRAKQEEQEHQALQRLAATYVNTAQETIDSGRGYAAAAHHVQSAIEVVRKIPNTKEQEDQLHIIMMEYQKKSLNELGRITSGTIDLTKQIESAIILVKDKPLSEAIFALALFTGPVSRKYMDGFVDEMAKKSPLFAFISSNVVNSNGKVVAKRDSLLTGSADQMAEAKEAEMYHWAQSEQSILGSIVDHTRRFILTEHNPNIRDFLEIVANNPFIPPGREIIFAKGFLSGMQGDFPSCLHFLIPQIENSIRYVLNRDGVITSGLNKEGIQEEFDLNKLLDMPETTKKFHEDLLFGLKGTLISKFGRNFRNLLAHGLLDYDNFLSYDAVYVWWLILKIICMPIFAQKESTDASPKE